MLYLCVEKKQGAMARQARIRSTTGIYHIMLRGINKQQIFHKEADYQRMLNLLVHITRPGDDAIFGKGTVPNQGFASFIAPTIYAYCLMKNHLHLLIKEGSEEIGQSMKRLETPYANYYNKEYDRRGHLFENRFKSEPVENWDYFRYLLRYIHRNPCKAGIVARPEDYAYSSWHQFLGGNGICNVETTMRRISLAELSEWVNAPDEEGEYEPFEPKKRTPREHIEVTVRRPRLSDDEVRELVEQVSGRNFSEFQQQDLEEQQRQLAELKQMGCSHRQLSRITGVSQSFVRRS